MASIRTTFDFRPDAPLAPLLAALAEHGTVRAQAPRRVEVCYLDTVDGRLFQRRAGLSLEVESGERSLHLTRAQEELVAPAGATPPAFFWDLPAGPLAERVETLASVRRLLPLVQLRLERVEFALVADDGSTTAQGRIERGVASRPGNLTGAPLPTRVIFTDIDPSSWPAIGRRLELAGGHRPEGPTAARPEIELSTAGITAPSRRMKIAPPIRATMNSSEALRVIHRQLLERIVLEQQGTVADIDSEFLHDFRVAVRRTRAALAQLPGIYDPRRHEHFKAGFKWLAQATGPTRDLDVLSIQLREYRLLLRAEHQPGLDLLRDRVEARRQSAQRDLAALIDSDRYARLIGEWRAFLDGPATGDTGPNAARPIGARGAGRLRRSLSRFERLGRSIGPESHSADLHRLRLRGKKLRYLIEFLRALYPAALIDDLVGSMRGLQDTLGAHQDYEYQQHALAALADEIEESGPRTGATASAVDRLLALIGSRQATERSMVERRFDAFVGSEAVRDFRVWLDEQLT